MPRPVLALEIGRTGQTRSCLCRAGILVGGGARQGTSKISKQDHFPESARRKRTLHSGLRRDGRGLAGVPLSYLRGISWRSRDSDDGKGVTPTSGRSFHRASKVQGLEAGRCSAWQTA